MDPRQSPYSSYVGGGLIPLAKIWKWSTLTSYWLPRTNKKNNNKKHHPALHKVIIPPPNPTAQLAVGERSHVCCQTGTSFGHRELYSDTLVAQWLSLSRSTFSFEMLLIFRECFFHRYGTWPELYVLQSTLNVPHECLRKFWALMNLARGQALLLCCCCCFFILTHRATHGR